jgi:hypothetical protein
MLTCKSPRKVMLVAFGFAKAVLPDYSSKFSRHDYTLAQLLACLVLKEQVKASYRGVQALLGDCPHWCHAIGMKRVPDHNTLCRVARVLLKRFNVNRLLDAMARCAALNRALRLGAHPLAGDSSMFERHHVSGHFAQRRRRESRRARIRRMRGKRPDPGAALKRLPKLGITVATASHLVLSLWCGTGSGCDSPHFEPLLRDARRRIARRLRRRIRWRAQSSPCPANGRPQHHPSHQRKAQRQTHFSLASAHATHPTQRPLTQALRLHPTMASRNGYEHDQAEPGLSPSRPHRPQPPPRPGPESPHPQPDDLQASTQGRDRAGHPSFLAFLSTCP